MTRVPLAKLVALQQHRSNEIEAIGARMRERAPATLHKTIVQTRINTVNERWAEIRKAHDEITLRTDSEDHAYITENRYQDMHQAYENTLDWLLTSLADLSDEVESSGRSRDRESDGELERPAKLPRLELPTFSGKYEDWDSFADIFTTLVHDAPRIADTTKLQYLKLCLKGSASELVKDVPIVGVNYASTWKALKDRFHNPRLTINKLLDSFLNTPQLKRESAVELRAFIDHAQRIVRALTNLRAPVVHWDLWLVHILEVRLDPESRKEWEAELSAKDRRIDVTPSTLDHEDDYFARIPKFADLAAFLERRAVSLTVIHADKGDSRSTQPVKAHPSSRRVHHVQSTRPGRSGKCFLCSGEHFISQCPTFMAKGSYDRQTDVRQLRLCFNCLGKHRYKDCKSYGRCITCREKHHSLLHLNKRPQNQSGTSKKENPSNNSSEGSVPQVRTHVAQMTTGPGLSFNACYASAPRSKCSILLATAQVIVIGPDGKQTRARALLDQGSEATFISESLVQMLGLTKNHARTSLTGVGGCAAGVVKSVTCFTMQSQLDSNFKLEVDAYVLPRLTSELPARNLVELDLGQFADLTLADPEFHISDRVDIMIGADLYGQLLRSGLRTFPTTLLVAQNTALGWIISGPTQGGGTSRRAVPTCRTAVTAMRCAVNDDLSEAIQRFWALEELPAAAGSLKPCDEACEKLFAESHTRDSDGRFKVRLPLKSEPPRVADETRRMALGSLKHQLQRLSRDSNLARAYTEFMDTYIQLGHMVPVPTSELENPRSWYLPHHAVVQGDTTLSKIRVVFDASRRTREQSCLNDFLMAGPALQSDLSLILLNWRRYRYVFTADIVKMFRQIRVVPEDQDLQRILWPAAPGAAPTDYRLTTVTYGTACAPYLAIRTLLQVAKDGKARFPLGSRCIEANTYVDDMFAGADELPMALRKRDELVDILNTAGMALDKWAANHSDLLPTSHKSSSDGIIKEIDCDSAVKTLGVHWNPASDRFHFTTSSKNRAPLLTKRSVYSDIARLFDPLGWLAPITVIAKVLMQDLWIAKCEWDEPLPAEIRKQWLDYCQSLSALPTLSIDRWIGLSHNKPFQIHGFSDASSRAYAAAVYLRLDEGEGTFRVSLLAAKTKAAPIKTKSIPNLELCGATLLVKLVCHLRKLQFLTNASIYLWSDSQIVLTWLKKHPCHWKTFVANRVSLIQTELPSAVWSHVPTKQNPADLATRGVIPAELGQTDLWWHGPSWLASPSQSWPQAPIAVQSLHIQTRPDEPEILSRYSTLTRLTRITAWCLRPLLQRRRKQNGQGSFPSTLTTTDLNYAQNTLVKLAQTHAFPQEIELLKAGKALAKHSPLRKLKPFVDKDDGILRVGGRLSNSNLPRHVQHPPILPRLSDLSRLFVSYAHRRALHGGPTLTTSILLRFSWILDMRLLDKTAIHYYVTCQRHKPRLAHQLMGDLPASRVTPARPFTSTGLGPSAACLAPLSLDQPDGPTI